MDKKLGHYSFIGGVVIAFVLGLARDKIGADASTWLVSLMVLLGIVVGLINVTGKQTKEFMMVATVLIIASFAGGASSILNEVAYIGQFLSGVFSYILSFVIPATVVIALKDVWALGQVE